MCTEVKDFLTDNNFIDFVLNEAPHLHDYWESYFKEHSEQIAIAEEAREILLAPVDVVSDISPDELQNLKDRIIVSLKDCLDS